MLQPVLQGEFQANAIAPRELQRRALALGVVDWSNGVDDVIPVGIQDNVSYISAAFGRWVGGLTLGDCSPP